MKEPILFRRHDTLSHDQALYWKDLLYRTVKIGTEVKFALSKGVRKDDFLVDVRHRANLLRGRFATLSVNLAQPGRLLALKNEMPFCVHYHALWQALCFSSRYLFWRKAFGRSIITEALDSQRIYRCDAKRLPERGKEPLGALPIVEARP